MRDVLTAWQKWGDAMSFCMYKENHVPKSMSVLQKLYVSHVRQPTKVNLPADFKE
jgi:hypothetical protein